MSFSFEVGQYVKIGNSEKEYEITGRAEYNNHPNQYQVKTFDEKELPIYAWYDEQDVK